MPGWNVQYILCRWADVVKSTPSMLKKSQKPAWNEDGDLLQDSTSAYSEMPGELREYKNAQHKKAMTATINKPLDEALREKGLL